MGAIVKLGAAVVIGAGVLPAVLNHPPGHGNRGRNQASLLGSVLGSGAHIPSHPSGNVEIGRAMAAKRGWTGHQWTCLYLLWNGESGWSATAENSKSGAYGIAQALGHGPTNQYPAGPANPPVSSPRAQVAWGEGYIAHNYGTPCTAYQDWLSRSPHWY